MAGKGDKPRPMDRERFAANWERIFGGDGKSTVTETGKALAQDGGSTPPASTISYGYVIDQPEMEAQAKCR